jgi:two-component system, response regulator PdtaR
MKSVIIAFSNPLLTGWVTSVLNRGGYSIEYAFKTAGDVVRVADFCTSPVVVSGFQFTDMTAEDLKHVLDGRLELVTIVLPHQRDLIERDDMTVVPYPLTPVDLLQAIELVEKNAAESAVHSDVSVPGKARQSERPAEEKLLILKAKNVLMESMQMTESQAHRFLQKSSMDRGLKLIDAAKMVIENSMVL